MLHILLSRLKSLFLQYFISQILIVEIVNLNVIQMNTKSKIVNVDILSILDNGCINFIYKLLLLSLKKCLFSFKNTIIS